MLQAVPGQWPALLSSAPKAELLARRQHALAVEKAAEAEAAAARRAKLVQAERYVLLKLALRALPALSALCFHVRMHICFQYRPLHCGYVPVCCIVTASSQPATCVSSSLLQSCSREPCTAGAGPAGQAAACERAARSLRGLPLLLPGPRNKQVRNHALCMSEDSIKSLEYIVKSL